MTLLTSYLIGILDAANVLPRRRLYNELALRGLPPGRKDVQWLEVTHSDSRAKYNEWVRIGAAPLARHCTSLLPKTSRGAVIRDECRAAVVQVEACYSELLSALHDYCPRYEVATGESQYAPVAMRRRRPGGSEVDSEGAYIFAIEIDGSIGEDSRLLYKTALVGFVDQVDAKHTLFQEEHRHCFAIVSTDVITIIELLAAFRMAEGEIRAVEPSMTRVRKALSFGAICTVTLADGSRHIRGTRFPDPFEEIRPLLRSSFVARRTTNPKIDCLLVTVAAYRAIAHRPGAPADFHTASLSPGSTDYEGFYEVKW